jgi:hypothetical protein
MTLKGNYYGKAPVLISPEQGLRDLLHGTGVDVKFER